MRRLILTAALLGLGSASALAAPAVTHDAAPQQVTTQQQNSRSAFVGEVASQPVAQVQNGTSPQHCLIGPAWVHVGRLPWRAGQHSW